MARFSLLVNGKPNNVDVQPGMPLLWVLRDTLGLTGTKFGCSEGYCGCCTVIIDGDATKSCGVPVESTAGKRITMIEGLSSDRSHPVQRAWIEEEVPQAGIANPDKSWPRRLWSERIRNLPMRTSMPRCLAYSAGVGHISGSGALSIMRRR